MAQIQYIPVAILYVLNWAIIYVIIIEYRYLTVPTMYACHPLQRCMYHGVVICVWVSAQYYSLWRK